MTSEHGSHCFCYICLKQVSTELKAAKYAEQKEAAREVMTQEDGWSSSNLPRRYQRGKNTTVSVSFTITHEAFDKLMAMVQQHAMNKSQIVTQLIMGEL